MKFTNIISDAWRSILPHLGTAALISGVSNLLLLTPTLYMLVLYQRVVPTGRVETLLGVAIAALAATIVIAIIDGQRFRVLAKSSARLNRSAIEGLYYACLDPTVPELSRHQALKHYESIRQVITGPAILAILDAPWVLVFVLASFLLHPLVGLAVLLAAVLLIAIMLLAQGGLSSLSKSAQSSMLASDARLRTSIFRAKDIQILGMRRALCARSVVDRKNVDNDFLAAVFAAGEFNALSAFVRQSAQIIILGLATYLAVSHQTSPAIIFAASLLLSRTLAPFEQITSSIRQINQAREAAAHLRKDLLDRVENPRPLNMMPPSGQVSFDRLVLAAPSRDRVLLSANEISVNPGEFVVITGPSGSGKSTLLAAIAGVYPCAAGTIRHGGLSIREWDKDYFTTQIGFCGAEPILFQGSIADNISRFDPRGTNDPIVADSVVSAAKACGVHDLILSLRQGYQTQIGPTGDGLSSGQAQRVALGRALHGGPKLLILDEPDSHLDDTSAAQLGETLVNHAAMGGTVFLVTHSRAMAAHATRYLKITDGVLCDEEEAPL